MAATTASPSTGAASSEGSSTCPTGPCSTISASPCSRLHLVGQGGDQQARAEEARRLLAVAETPEAALPGWGEEVRAHALVQLGDAETWTGRLDLAELHLEQAMVLARRIGRPYLEFTALTFRAEIELNRRLPRAFYVFSLVV